MKKLIRNSACLLLSLTALVSFAACSQNAGKAEAATSSASGKQTETAAELKPTIPDYDFKGGTFTILSRTNEVPIEEVVAEEENGEPVNDAIYRRNREAEEAFGMKIKRVQSANVVNDVNKSVMSGDSAYDIVDEGMNNGIALASAGALYSYDKLPYADLSKPWWDQYSAKVTSVYRKNYFAIGDFSLLTKEYAKTVLFNKAVYKKFGYTENLYDTVRSGKWTIDKLHTLASGVTSDLNGDGKLGEGDLFGLISGNVQSVSMFYGTGLSFTAKDSDDAPVINNNTESLFSAFSKIFKLYNDTSVTYYSFADNNAAVAQFAAGNALFMNHDFYLLSSLRDMEDDYGILPMPKYDEKQDNYYVTFSTRVCTSFMVPVSNPEPERTSAVLEELSYLSHEYVTKAYYDIVLSTKYARDEDSSEMLDLLFSNYNIDFLYMNVGDATNLVYNFYTLVGKNSDTFASVYASVVGNNATYLKTLADTLAK